MTAPGININTTVDRRFAGCVFSQLPGNSGRGKGPQLKADARSDERKAGLTGMAERLEVPTKPGNSGGGKGPQLKADARSDDGKGEWR